MTSKTEIIKGLLNISRLCDGFVYAMGEQGFRIGGDSKIEEASSIAFDLLFDLVYGDDDARGNDDYGLTDVIDSLSTDIEVCMGRISEIIKKVGGEE